MSKTCCRTTSVGLHRRNPSRPVSLTLRATFDTLLSSASAFVDKPILADIYIAPAADFPNARDFAYCHVEPDWAGKRLIGVAPKLEVQKAERVVALLMHEIAHAALMQMGVPDHSEREADQMAEALWDVPLYYDSEYVQTLREGGIRPRPSHLPR